MKRKIKLLITLLLSSVFFVQLAACGESQNNSQSASSDGSSEEADAIADTDISLVAGGQSEYKIVTAGDDTSPTEKYASEFLQTQFKNATDILLPIVSDEDADLDENEKIISVGATSIFEDTGLTVTEEELNVDGFRLKRYGNTVVLAAAEGSAGIIYAAQEFLKHEFDYEVYASDEVYLETGVTDVKLKDFDILDTPDFWGRSMDGLLQYNPDLALSLRMRTDQLNVAEYGYGSARDWIPGGAHTFRTIVNPDDYPEHKNDWFLGNQLCLTNAELISTFAGNLEQMILDNPQGRIVFMGEMDFGGFCSCPNCSEEITRYGLSGYLIRFCNKVIDIIETWKAETEEVKNREWVYGTFCYTSSGSIIPPVTQNADGEYAIRDESCRPHEKLYVRLTPLTPACYYHSLRDAGQSSGIDSICTESNKIYNYFEGWSAITDRIMVWDYDANFSGYYIFYNDFDTLQENLQYYKEKGVVNIFRENTTGSAQRSLGDLNAYLNAKLMWNVDADMEQLMNDFLTHFYKDGAEYMRQYIDLMRGHWAMMDATSEGGFHAVSYSEITAQANMWPIRILEQAMDILEQATASYAYLETEDPVLYSTLVDRVREEMMCIRFMILGNYSNYYDINAKAYDELIDQFEADCQYFGCSMYREGQGPDSFIKSLREN